MAHEIIHPRTVHPTAGVGYSHVARAGNTVYIAGQIALDPQGHLIGRGDIALQAHRVYANLRAILEELGGGLGNIVKMTTYMTRRDDLAEFRRVRNTFFVDPFPPNTLLFVSGLAHPDYLIEVEAIAVIDAADRTAMAAGCATQA